MPLDLPVIINTAMAVFSLGALIVASIAAFDARESRKAAQNSATEARRSADANVRSADAQEGLHELALDKREGKEAQALREAEAKAAQALEAQRARIKIGVPSTNQLAVTNTGPTAREIIIAITSAQLGRPDPDWFGSLRFDELGHDTAEILDWLGPKDAATKVNVEVSWTDGAGGRSVKSREVDVLFPDRT